MEIDLSKNFLIQFNEDNNIGDGVALTDSIPVLVGTRHRLPSTNLIKLILPEIRQKLKPFACTFTYSINKVAEKKPQVTVFKNGNSRTKLIDILLVNYDPLKQWLYFKQDFYKFCDKFNRLGFSLNEYHCYPEFTQQGLIHVHALLYHDCEGWGTARAQLMATTWCKVSGSRMVAQVKNNGHGNDYSFAQCNNVVSWLTYIRKEQQTHNII